MCHSGLSHLVGGVVSLVIKYVGSGSGGTCVVHMGVSGSWISIFCCREIAAVTGIALVGGEVS